jgi:hypothetical protein
MPNLVLICFLIAPGCMYRERKGEIERQGAGASADCVLSFTCSVFFACFILAAVDFLICTSAFLLRAGTNLLLTTVIVRDYIYAENFVPQLKRMTMTVYLHLNNRQINNVWEHGSHD